MTLQVDAVHFSYGEKNILKGVSLSLDPKEIGALIGVSGSGKTTLFKLITGVMKPSKGEIRVDPPQLTYMRQEDLLLPWRDVLGNLLLFTELGRREKKVSRDLQAKELLKRVGLEGYENRYPKELSGGMRQRVSLARALLQERPLLLLDEPFGSLDVLIREELYTLLREIRDHMHKTMLLVTHDFRDALALADRIFILRDSKIGKTFTLSDQTRRDPLASAALIEEIRSELSVAPLPSHRAYASE